MSSFLISLCLLLIQSSNSMKALAVSDQATLEMHSVELDLPDGNSVVAERGVLWVPVVRSNPESKKVGVDVWRFKARTAEPSEAPPVFLLHGGPGWPGMEPETIQWRGNVERITRFTDCVVVGQRGIGTSSDTSCSIAFENLEQVPGDDASAQEQRDFIQARCLDCREHWQAAGYDLSGFNVIEAAGDVADVRRLLGYDKVVLWGVSFGSHWGMATMRFHPEIVERAVLSGMEGPNHTYDSPSAVLDGIKLMAASAESSSRLADYLPEEGLVAAFAGLIEGVEEEPFEVEARNPRSGKMEEVLIDADALRGVALGLGARISSRNGMPYWPANIITMLNGDFELLARNILGNQGLTGLPTASFFMLDCGSGITRARLKELRNDPAIKIVGDLSEFYENTCSVWNADLGDAFRSNFVSDISTVVVHGLWDVSTPFGNALECIPLFSNLTFIPVDGGSHGALEESMTLAPGFEQAILEFVKSGDTQALPSEVRLPEISWRIPTD